MPPLNMHATGRQDEAMKRAMRMTANYAQDPHPPIWVQLTRLAAERGISHAELSRRCGVIPGEVCSCTTPGYLPRLSTLEKIARALNCDVRIELVPFGRVPELATENRRSETERAEARA